MPAGIVCTTQPFQGHLSDGSGRSEEVELQAIDQVLQDENIWIYPVYCDYVWTGCMLYFTLGFVSKQLADVLGFVFTKSRLRTRYESLFLVFSGRLYDAIMSGMMSLTVKNVFMETIFQECVFGR